MGGVFEIVGDGGSDFARLSDVLLIVVDADGQVGMDRVVVRVLIP